MYSKQERGGWEKRREQIKMMINEGVKIKWRFCIYHEVLCVIVKAVRRTRVVDSNVLFHAFGVV